MSNFKYLSDGRKVVVIGQLNNTESIVQEVFVTPGGDEIPSGERFVTKSLHDEPVKSWKEKEQDKLEAAIKRLKSDREAESNKIHQIKQKLKGYREVFKQVKLLADNLPESNLEELTLFMSGSVEWLVFSSKWELHKPVRFEDEFFYSDRDYDRYRFDGLKLMDMLGKSNGDITFRMNRWNDGSGNDWREVKPFSDWDSAVAYVKQIADAKIADGSLREKDYKVCKELGFEFTEEQMESIRNRLLGSLEESLRNAKSDAEKRINEAGRRLIEMREKLS